MQWIFQKDYYVVLGVPRDATDVEIRKAFLRRVKEVHPDLLGPEPSEPAVLEANELLKEVNEAYENLSDAAKRTDFGGSYYRPPAADTIDVPEPESFQIDGVWCWVEYNANAWSGRLNAKVRVSVDGLFEIDDLSKLPHEADIIEVLAYDIKGDTVGRSFSLRSLRNEIRTLQAQARRNERRRFWLAQLAELQERCNQLNQQGKTTARLQQAIDKATDDAESGRIYLGSAKQESTVVRSIREAEKEAERTETLDASDLLLADLLGGEIRHPDLDYNAALLKKLDVYNFRTGGQCGIPTAEDVRALYERRIAGLSTHRQVLQVDLKLADEIPTILELAAEGALTLSPDSVLINGNKGPSSYKVEYGRAKINGEFVPAGMITVPESVHNRNGAQHGRASLFPTLPHGITLVIRVKVKVLSQEMLTQPLPDGKGLGNEVRRCQARLRNPQIVEEPSFSSIFDLWQY